MVASRSLLFNDIYLKYSSLPMTTKAKVIAYADGTTWKTKVPE